MDLNQKAFFDKAATEWDSKNHHDPENKGHNEHS